MKQIVILLLLVFNGIHIFAQTTGNLNVSVTTSSTGGNYAPKNILAIWIEDASGNFIKTLLTNADKRITHLNTWEAATTKKGGTYNRVDAVTGATLSNHGTRTCTWNGTDYTKNLVADGVYYVCMELTDKNATGKFSKFSFTKGENSTVTPANVASFSSLIIKWVASGTTAVQETVLTNDIQIFPNPAKNVFHVKGDNISDIEILNLAGALVFKNNSTTRIDMTNFKNGIYLVRIKQGNATVVKKLVKE